MPLPILHVGALDHDKVMVTFRLLATTPKAYRIAAPCSDPIHLITKSAWVPQSRVLLGSQVGFQTYWIVLPVWLYKRVREQLA